MIKTVCVLNQVFVSQICSISVQPASLLLAPHPPWPPHEGTKYEQHFLLRSPTVTEYLLKREECALICQGDLS